MNSKQTYLVTIVAALFLGFGAIQSASAHDASGAPAKLGKVHFKVECNAAAQKEFDLAMAYYHSFAWELYKAPLYRALELKPDLAVAYMYRGVLFTQLGDLKRASADHARLLKLDRTLAAKLEAVIVSRVVREGNEGLSAQYE